MPSSWGAVGSFPVLSGLHFENMPIIGSLPPSWGNEACPGLTILQLSYLNLSATLPSEWGSPSNFQQLQELSVSRCNVTGTLFGAYYVLPHALF